MKISTKEHPSSHSNFMTICERQKKTWKFVGSTAPSNSWFKKKTAFCPNSGTASSNLYFIDSSMESLEWCWCLQVLGPFSAEKNTALDLWKPWAPQHKVVISGVRDPNKWPQINGYNSWGYGVTSLTKWSEKTNPTWGSLVGAHLAVFS